MAARINLNQKLPARPQAIVSDRSIVWGALLPRTGVSKGDGAYPEDLHNPTSGRGERGKRTKVLLRERGRRARTRPSTIRRSAFPSRFFFLPR